MTCIVGLEHNGDVYIGADSASVGSWSTRATRIPKVFQRGKFLIGYTTSFRMGQILQYHLDVPPQKKETDEEYMVVRFVEAARKCLKDKGFTTVDKNVETGGQFLVGYNGKLYECETDFQIGSMVDGLDSVGCGFTYALGPMRALEAVVINPMDRIELSLEIVAGFDGKVCAPFTVLRLEE